MLTIAHFYQAPVDGDYVFQVMIRDKAGVTLGLVHDTLAATMPAYDESFEDPESSGSVTAHFGWSELDGDDGEGRDSEDEDSEGDNSEDDSGGRDGIEDVDSVAYDSEGNVLEDSSSSMKDSSSEVYEYTEHESELGSDTGYEAQDDEENATSKLQTTE